MNINRDGIDVKFKLCSPTEIMFDITTRLFDKK